MSAPARSAGAKEVHEQVEHLRVQDGGRFKVLAGGGGAGEDENARADDGADAERGERPRAEGFFQPMPGRVGVRDELVDGFAAGSWLPAVGSACWRVLVGCANGSSRHMATLQGARAETQPALAETLTYRFACAAHQFLHFALRRTARVVARFKRLLVASLLASGAF